MELYKKYRPDSLAAVVGQNEVVKSVEKFIENNSIPHFILLSGASGCGKTTIARILKEKLNCNENDYQEYNAADSNGIDMVRDIRRSMSLTPAFGSCKIFYFDEAHKLTSAAQGALLKILEDTPSHVYFIFTTTDPQMLSKPIRSRATELVVKPLSDKEMKNLLSRIIRKEKKEVSEKVIDKIIEIAEGGIRKALVILNQVIDVDDGEKQLNLVEQSQTEKQGIDIARALLNDKTTWKAIANILKDVTDEPETIRYIVLGYMNSVMLREGRPNVLERCFNIIDVFKEPFYNSKKAGLTAACYEIISAE